MTRSTEDLIALLSGSGPVRPLPAPTRRTMAWLGVALPYALLTVLALRPREDLGVALRQAGFVVDLGAALAAAVAASAAAFATAVPGCAAWRRTVLVAAPALWCVWSLGSATVAGIAAAPALAGWECVPTVLVVGALPMVFGVRLLRRAAPLTPTLTMAMLAVAAAALGHAATILCHASDEPSHLVWHAAAVGTVVAAGAWAGRRVLRWERVRAT